MLRAAQRLDPDAPATALSYAQGRTAGRRADFVRQMRGSGNPLGPALATAAPIIPFELMDPTTRAAVMTGAQQGVSGAARGAKRFGSKAMARVQEMAGNVAADPQAAARAAFMAPAQALAAGTQLGMRALESPPPRMPTFAQAGAGLRSAANAAPGVAGAVGEALPVLAQELTGAPSARRTAENYARMQERAYDYDPQGAARAAAAGVGETLMSGASAAGLPALAMMGARGGAAVGRTAMRAADDVAGAATAASIGGAALTVPEAAAQTRQQIEDQYVQADGMAPMRPDGGRALREGVFQGLLLDNYDDMTRRGTVEERAQLAEEIEAARANGASPEEFARLAQRERDLDPVTWEARTSPEQFAQGRLMGELGTGATVALGVSALGQRAFGPAGNNLAAGFLKGLAYGFGSETGEVPLEDRQANAVQSGLISGGISGLAVPFTQGVVREIDNAPIRIQERLRQMRPNAPKGKDWTRLTAQRQSVLASDVAPDEAVQLARLADIERAQQGVIGRYMRPPTLEARIQDMVLGNQAGADAFRANAAPPPRRPPAPRKPAALPPPIDEAEAARLTERARDLMTANRPLTKAEKIEVRALEQQLKKLKAPAQPRAPRTPPAPPPPLLQPLPTSGQRPNTPMLDSIVPRVDNTSAAALGAALARPSAPVNPRIDADPLSPRSVSMQRLFTSRREPGLRQSWSAPNASPLGRPSQEITLGDALTKGLATFASIPATGVVNEFINPIMDQIADDQSGKSDWLLEQERLEQEPPQAALGADDAMRRRLAMGAVYDQLGQARSALITADQDARGVIEQQRARTRQDIEIIRAAMTPRYVTSRNRDGQTVSRYHPAYALALRSAKAAGITPSQEALDEAISRLDALSPMYEIDSVREQTAQLIERNRRLQAEAQALERPRK
jgi:hypothetical protein